MRKIWNIPNGYKSKNRQMKRKHKVRTLDIIKMSIPPKLIYKHNMIQIKIPASQKNSDKEEQLLFILSIKIYYKTSIIKIVWWWGMNTDRQKWKEPKPTHNPSCILKLVHSKDNISNESGKGGHFNKCFEDY